MASLARIGVLAIVILLLTFIVATAAYAATKVGTNGSNLLFGTDRGDILYGLYGGDHLRGKQGSDELYAGAGKDEARGSRGDDYMLAVPVMTNCSALGAMTHLMPLMAGVITLIVATALKIEPALIKKIS